MTARQIKEQEGEIKAFCSVVKGTNFITPNIEGYYRVGKYVCELSYGTYCMSSFPVGVTVVNTETMEQEFDMSQAFFEKDYETSMRKAREYMATL